MGFKFAKREVVLTFEEPFEGLEIRCPQDFTTDAYFDLVDQVAAAQAAKEGRAQLRAMLALFVDCIAPVWNAENEDGTPLSLTVDTLMSVIPVQLAGQIIPRWKDAVTGGGAPLGEPSPNGDTSEEPSEQTETP